MEAPVTAGDLGENGGCSRPGYSQLGGRGQVEPEMSDRRTRAADSRAVLECDGGASARCVFLLVSRSVVASLVVRSF